MPLECRPMTLGDFDTASKYRYNHDGGDVCAPVLPFCWPTTSDDESMLKRTAWSMAQQRYIFEHDPTCRFMKVVDTDNDNEIIALARWHFYEDGYKHPEMTAQELNPLTDDDEDWHEGLNTQLAKDMLVPVFEGRQSWCGGGPQYGKLICIHPFYHSTTTLLYWLYRRLLKSTQHSAHDTNDKGEATT